MKMAKLQKTLELCATEDAMDYCIEFDGIQSILEHFNRNVRPFKTLGTFCPGQDDVVNRMAQRLQAYFLERRLIDSDSKKPLKTVRQTWRKLLMFLLLNTDATYKYNLHDDNFVAHVLEICPLMPKFLIVTLIMDLKLHHTFYEALAYTPYWFSWQFIVTACEYLQTIDSAKLIMFMCEDIIKCLLVSLLRSLMLEMRANERQTVLTRIYGKFIELLLHFETPKLKSYPGYSLKHLLRIILYAFDVYETKTKFVIAFHNECYDIGSTFKQEENAVQSSNSSAVVEAEKFKIINVLLDCLEASVKRIDQTSDTEWAEVKKPVGKMACKLRQRMSSNNSFPHDIDRMLDIIEIRDRSFGQIVSEATIGEILQALDDAAIMPYEKTKMWYDELFKRGLETLSNTDCLDVIMSLVKLTSKENCVQLMTAIKKVNELNKNPTDINTPMLALVLKDLLHTAANELENADLIDLLEYRLQLFGLDSEALLDDLTNFEAEANVFFNKYASAFELQPLLLLSLKHPYKLWSDFFSLACHFKEAVYYFCFAVRKTLPGSFAYIDEIFKNAMLNQTLAAGATYFAKVFAELYFLIYKIRKPEFIGGFLNPHIQALLCAQDFGGVLPLMNALEIIATYDETLNFEQLTPPTLVMVADIAERARWTTVETFNDVRAYVLTSAIKFIKETLQRYLPVMTEKDRVWLASMVTKRSGPFVQYHFQKLIAAANNQLSLHDFMLRSFKDEELQGKTDAIYVKKLLYRCIPVEFTELMVNEDFYKKMPNVLLQIAEKMNENPSEMEALNFRYCFDNFLNFFNCNHNYETGRDGKVFRSIAAVIDAATKYNAQIFMATYSALKQSLACYITRMQNFSIDFKHDN